CILDYWFFPYSQFPGHLRLPIERRGELTFQLFARSFVQCLTGFVRHEEHVFGALTHRNDLCGVDVDMLRHEDLTHFGKQSGPIGGNELEYGSLVERIVTEVDLCRC